jgi:hypothetical protein
MTELKMIKIVFADLPCDCHFVTFNSGDHEAEVVADRHDIDIEVMVPGTEKIENIEAIAREKAKRFLSKLVKSL